MKKYIYALLAIAATLSFASCNEDFKEENGLDPSILSDNTIAFSLKKIDTRSGDGSNIISINTYSLGEPIDGVHYILEETVTRLDDVYYTPETKGTPVYTENFANMFSAFYGVGFTESDTEHPVVSDGAFGHDKEYRWVRELTSNPFADNEELYFFLRSHDAPTGVSNLAYRVSGGRCFVDFHYEVPLNGSAQQDLLFTGRPITREQAKSDVPILFQHALTGVKFASAYDNEGDAKTYITKVEIPHALFRSADITLRSSYENGKWEDDPDVYSSSASGNMTVNSGQQLTSSEVFTLNFKESDLNTFETGGSFGTKGKYPDSFAAGGNENNLNDTDASKTFWLIQQRMNNNVVLDVTFHIVSGGKDSGPITRRIEIGKLQTNAVTWRAGELRTFTLKPEYLDVDITDKVSGFEKTDVVITNTGNVDAFIRAHITGNWFGMAGTEYSVAIGYKSRTSNEFVAPWKMSDGTFEDLPNTGWHYNSNDGFYYYESMVPAGATIPNNLFTKYSISGSNIPPEVWYVDSKNVRHQFSDVELVMEIPVQAIEAIAGKTYTEAWSEAGVTF